MAQNKGKGDAEINSRSQNEVNIDSPESGISSPIVEKKSGKGVAKRVSQNEEGEYVVESNKDELDLKHKEIESIKKSYEESRYVNSFNIYPSSFPERIGALANIFSVKAKKSKFKVLEIGCGNGDNITAMAYIHKDSHFIGIDLVESAIQDGNRRAEELDLKNVEFKSMSFTDINKKEFGEFDYVIAHGVYSWISPEMQEYMFKIISGILAPEGIFYASYNTLPGWNSVKSVRDYLRFACGNMSEKEKAQQVPQHLMFLRDSLKDRKDNYALGVVAEVETLLNRIQENGNIGYIMHDHMEETNHPVYFFDMCQVGAKHGMQYLSDVSLGSLVVPPSMSKLNEVTNKVQQQSYMDYLLGRRFRSSLFVRSSVSINNNITANSLHDINFQGAFYVKDNEIEALVSKSMSQSLKVTSKIDNLEIHNQTSSASSDSGDSSSKSNATEITSSHLSFKDFVLSKDVSNLVEITMMDRNVSVMSYPQVGAPEGSISPVIKACLIELSRLKFKSMNFAEMVQSISSRYGFKPNEIETGLYDILIKSIVSGYITPTTLSWKYIPTAAPKLSKFVRNQLDRGSKILMGTCGASFGIDLVFATVLHNCNGKNTSLDIKEVIMKAIKEGTISATSNTYISPEQLEAQILTRVQAVIDYCNICGVFEQNA